jgi:hypothetical protein
MKQGLRTLLQSFVALAVIVLGCAGESLERVRAATYPPDFHYITKQEIRTTMGSLALEVYALDQIMWQPGGPRLGDRANVIEILSRMRSLSRQLKRREHSNHPRIHMHAPQLQRDIQRALLSARREPPYYYHAGLISGSCSYCHSPQLHRVPPAGAP